MANYEDRVVNHKARHTGNPDTLAIGGLGGPRFPKVYFKQLNSDHSQRNAPGMDETTPAACNDDGDDLVIGQGAPTESPDAAQTVFQAELAAPLPKQLQRRSLRVRPRRKLLPLNLFILTCFSTFLAGATQWHTWQFLITEPVQAGSLIPLRTAILVHWQDGLIYAACVLSILLTHEMGHFLATLYYRIPASFPYFIPLPVISPIGTMGAVIGMDGMRADRREMFDIGIAGPLAGLVIAIPITWIGITRLDLTVPVSGPYQFDSPLAVRLMMDAAQPEGYQPGQMTAHSQLNPFFMAGWVGLLVTGLNMMPVGQLDGGHITYALFGKRAHWIARAFMGVAILAMIVGAASLGLALMVGLVLFMIGTDHPPTSDDTAHLGISRKLLGFLSLAIPILCFAPKLIVPITYTTEIRLPAPESPVPAEQSEQDQTASHQCPPSRAFVAGFVSPSEKDPHGHEDRFQQHEPGSFVPRNPFQASREQPVGQTHLKNPKGAQECELSRTWPDPQVDNIGKQHDARHKVVHRDEPSRVFMS